MCEIVLAERSVARECLKEVCGWGDLWELRREAQFCNCFTVNCLRKG